MASSCSDITSPSAPWSATAKPRTPGWSSGRALGLNRPRWGFPSWVCGFGPRWQWCEDCSWGKPRQENPIGWQTWWWPWQSMWLTRHTILWSWTLRPSWVFWGPWHGQFRCPTVCQAWASPYTQCDSLPCKANFHTQGWWFKEGVGDHLQGVAWAGTATKRFGEHLQTVWLWSRISSLNHYVFWFVVSDGLTIWGFLWNSSIAAAVKE